MHCPHYRVSRTDAIFCSDLSQKFQKFSLFRNCFLKIVLNEFGNLSNVVAISFLGISDSSTHLVVSILVSSDIALLFSDGEAIVHAKTGIGENLP